MEPFYYVLFQPLVYISLLSGITFQLFLFHALTFGFPKFWPSTNKRSWILTTLSSIIMTVCSIPFVYQLFYTVDLKEFTLMTSPVATVTV